MRRRGARDPRVTVAVSDPDGASPCLQVCGRVRELPTRGTVEHIERLSPRYTGRPHPWYGGRDQARGMYVTEAESISGAA
ncbi:hypothetical protein [Actinacidiphila sp. bgisy160]|uniref:hypothetical protein n=1 Tax=Actinacidiphila sp. bgisy160 TaxID=3413796 RepID=UPI003D73DBA4